MTISNAFRAFTFLGPLLVGVLLAACVTTTPVELTTARMAYGGASVGPATQYAPSDLVITLSGSVPFRTNDTTLSPAAQTRLDEVADALVAKGRAVVVEGYTDSRGSQVRNLELSQRRADSVRTYLVSRGVPGRTITARGMSPDRPVAEDTTAEGRANNRRVEIVVAKNEIRAN